MSTVPGGFVQRVAGAVDEWWTPKRIFDALGVWFDLDVCGPGIGFGHVPAGRVYTEAEDGLAQPWAGRVWCNPPYKEAGTWVSRLADHGDGIGLVFARTDTRWVQAVLPRTDALVLISGRIKFLRAGEEVGTSGAPSMLLAYGDRNADAVLNSGLGFGIDLRKAAVA